MKDTAKKQETESRTPPEAKASAGESAGGEGGGSGEDIRELARAMNRLADAITDFTAMARDAKAENPDWAVFPSTLIDLSRRLTTLATRLR